MDSDRKASEFEVKFNNFEFVVECKHFAADTGKAATTASFAHLAHFISKGLPIPPLSGHILIELETRLPDDETLLRRMAAEVQDALRTGTRMFRFQDGVGEASLQVQAAAGIIATSGDVTEYAQSLSPGAHHHAIFSKSKQGNVSPLVLSCRSKRPAKVYEKLRDVLSNAKKQLGGHQGMIFVHYQGLLAGDVERLKVEPNFVRFNQDFLNENKNVAAVCYGAGPFSRIQTRDALYNEALQFKNPHFELPEGFSFINEGEREDSGIIVAAY
jgi:hypothetical protein